MDKEFKLIFNKKKLVGYVKCIIIVLLFIVETLICAQSYAVYIDKGGMIRLAGLFSCCILMVALEVVNTFAIKKFAAKLVFYGIESALLLAISLLTGSSYMSTLYCIILTQFYLTIDDLKTNIVLFVVSCVFYGISFVIGWVIVNRGASLYDSIVRIFGDCFFGVFTLAIHCAVTNFILKFYSTNIKLRHALKEADESKAQLKEVYEQLSQTAVYEERNRIAKDIHDNAGHSMTTVIMQTEAAKLLIDNNPEEAKNRIISANIQAKNALEQMRESVHLFAGRNQTRTLREEIEEIIAQTIDGTELKIRYDLTDITVGAEEYRFLLNSLKECLANGIRHGKSTAFYIEMKKTDAEMRLLISDNGCGVTGELSEGFGLKGMREKAESLGGKCVFSSEEGEGFEAEITLPVNNKN